MIEGSYPSARERAEESGPAKEPTRPAGPSGDRLLSTGHVVHIPGPYLMMFRSPEDPIPRPPSRLSILGQRPAPRTPTADPPSRHAPVPAGRVPPPRANTGFGVEYVLTARNSQTPTPEGPQPSPLAPPVRDLVRGQEVAQPQPSKMELICRNLRDALTGSPPAETSLESEL